MNPERLYRVNGVAIGADRESSSNIFDLMQGTKTQLAGRRASNDEVDARWPGKQSGPLSLSLIKRIIIAIEW